MGHPRPLFNLFSSFQTHITILTTNKCEKVSIHYPAPGFELTTFQLQVFSLNHQTWAPALDHQMVTIAPQPLTLSNPGLFSVYFCSFHATFYRKTVGFCGIRTRIVGVEGAQSRQPPQNFQDAIKKKLMKQPVFSGPFPASFYLFSSFHNS